METSLLNRVQATLLALATAALFVLAVFNILQERQFQQPDDGVWWREATGGLQAERVLPDMPGRARRHPGGRPADRSQRMPPPRAVTAVSRSRRSGTRTLPHRPLRPGLLHHHPRRHSPGYAGQGHSRAAGPQPGAGPARHRPHLSRSSASTSSSAAGAPRAPRTFTSSAWFRSRSTRSSTPAKLDALDWTVFWTNVVAEALQPALFLHFALSFPEERFKNVRRRWLLPLVYAPGAGLLGLWLLVHRPLREATGLLLAPARPDRHRLRRRRSTLLAALLFLRSYSRADYAAAAPAVEVAHPRHSARGACPSRSFTPSLFCFDLNPPRLLTNLAGLSLVFLPLTFSWAIVRYRLMDTDLIFKRGVAYTLATGLIARRLLRHHRAYRRGGPQRLPEAVREWGAGHRHSGHGRRLRSPQAPHSGLGRPRLRPPSLRLPQGAGRVRPRPQLRDRPPGAARFHRRAVAAHASCRPRRRLPGAG